MINIIFTLTVPTFRWAIFEVVEVDSTTRNSSIIIISGDTSTITTSKAITKKFLVVKRRPPTSFASAAVAICLPLQLRAFVRLIKPFVQVRDTMASLPIQKMKHSFKFLTLYFSSVLFSQSNIE